MRFQVPERVADSVFTGAIVGGALLGVLTRFAFDAFLAATPHDWWALIAAWVILYTFVAYSAVITIAGSLFSPASGIRPTTPPRYAYWLVNAWALVFCATFLGGN